MERFLTTPIFAVLLAIILLLGGLAGWQRFEIAHLETAEANARASLSDERTAHANTKQHNADVLIELASQAAKVATLVREREQQYLIESAAADDKRRKEKADAIARKDAVIADLRAGRLQLRPEWQCQTPAAGGEGSAHVAEPASSAGGNAGLAAVREESAGAFVQDGRDADSWIVWLQTELIATRVACGVGLP